METLVETLTNWLAEDMQEADAASADGDRAKAAQAVPPTAGADPGQLEGPAPAVHGQPVGRRPQADRRARAGTRFSRVPPQTGWTKLTMTAYRVLTAIAYFANPEGEAWPSLSTIAQFTQLDRRKISNAVGELVEAKLLLRSPRKNRHGGRTSTMYTLVYEAWVRPPNAH